MSFEDEIKLMNDSLEGDSAGTTAAPGTSAPGTSAPVTAAPEEISTDAPVTENPSTLAPATTAPVTEVPESNEIQTIAELRAEIEALKAEKSTESVPATAAPASIEPLNFVTEEEFEEAQTDPTKLNALLSKVYERSIADFKKEIDSVRSSLPNTISEQVQMQEELTRVRNDFYSANPDLEPFQKVVGIVFQELQQSNPDKPYQELLTKTGPEVRKRLKLPTESIVPEKKSKAPSLPNRRGRSALPNDNKPSNDVASQIAEMNKSLER